MNEPLRPVELWPYGTYFQDARPPSPAAVRMCRELRTAVNELIVQVNELQELRESIAKSARE